ncbi:hypothetical protein [Paenibacillus hubeiensis]|uniref:hypothetical protein n=1 Tax=Paenibacillus hubeiensis TaxID=3077330 RepID=UPI0031BA8B0C
MNKLAYAIGEQFASIFTEHLSESELTPNDWEFGEVEYIVIISNEFTDTSFQVRLIPDDENTDEQMIPCSLTADFSNSMINKSALEIIDRITVSRDILNKSEYAKELFTPNVLDGYIKKLWSAESRAKFQKGAK